MSRHFVHVFETDGTSESRFLKEAHSALRSGLATEVVLLCRWHPGLPREECPSPGIRVCRIPQSTAGLPRNKLLALLKIAETRWRYRRALRANAPALIQAHSLFPLPACAQAAAEIGVPLVYDAHELETERNGLSGLRQRLDRRCERRWIRHCDAVLCVSDSIADWYASAYRIARPTVVRNIPDLRLQSQGPGASRILRERFAIPDDALLFLYQGGLFPGRRLEQFLRVFERARPDRHLVFMGYGELEPLIQAAARRVPNLHFHPAVPPSDVLRHTASADVGLTGVENVCLSYFLSLPNKLFEYLAAGVPFLIPAYPEMRALVERHGCGWLVEESDDAWIGRVNGLQPAEVRAAQAAARQAAPLYSWQHEETRLLEVYRQVLAVT